MITADINIAAKRRHPVSLRGTWRGRAANFASAYRKPVHSVVLGLAIMSPSLSRAQNDEIQKQLSNPIASLTVVPIQSNFDFNIGPARDGSRVTTNIQPVIPIKLNDQMTLVVRTILPVVGQTDVFAGAGSQFGLGDTAAKLLLRAAVGRRLHLGRRAGAAVPDRHRDRCSPPASGAWDRHLWRCSSPGRGRSAF